MVGEMSVRGNVLVGKFPVGEVSFGEVSGWGIVRSGKCPSEICPRGSVSRGSAWSGNCPAILLYLLAQFKVELPPSKKSVFLSFNESF